MTSSQSHPHPDERSFFADILGHRIDTTLINPSHAQHSALLLHGAGESSKDRLVPMARTLTQYGYRTLTFSYPGHGASSGELKQSSLQERFSISAEIAKIYGFMQPKLLVGVSMGGHTAARLATNSKLWVDHLVLLVPAAYHAKAEHIRFNEGFSEIIRTPNSFVHSGVWEQLEHFNGGVSIFTGEHDHVIPDEVIQLYKRHAKMASSLQHFHIRDCSHMITAWLNDQPIRISHMIETIHNDSAKGFTSRYAMT